MKTGTLIEFEIENVRAIGFVYNTNKHGLEDDGIWMVGTSFENGGTTHLPLEQITYKIVKTVDKLK